MAEHDPATRTEEPTPRRREKAREEGQVARSVEVSAATVLLTAVVLLSETGGDTMAALREVMRAGLARIAVADLTPADAGWLVGQAGVAVALAAAPAVLAMALAGTASTVAQVGFGIYPKRLLPDPSRLSPANGVQRIFSRRGAVDLAKNVVKIALVALVAWRLVEGLRHRLPALGLASPREILASGASDVARMLLWVGLTLAVLAALDYLWQRRSLEQSLRMTRQEIKDELRQSEGDPKLRQRLKRAYRELSGNRMLSEVAHADVVVTNPTHYAVALRYRADESGAPRVVAKGADEVAERIKQIARQSGVPIIERRTLARALFRSVKVGAEIPASLYRAVAEVLAYIYGLAARKGA
ncbi:MAG: flagellar biosynthesis protein FlhB [Thermodesulfobacteriota bacterium]